MLDVIHALIETEEKIFVLTGSSARKLKRGGANLLAGRAFVYHLYPFSFIELGDKFNLSDTLQWGLLPKVTQLDHEDDKKLFLQAYAYTYIKEEIIVEQLIRKLQPFRKFLEVAAQCNGKVINYENIAREVNVDGKTIQNYFSLLEDTLLGFYLEPFHNSFRKRLSLKPKFYFFDLGVVRSLARQLSLPVVDSTSAYGEVFEHFVILECYKLANYFNNEFRFSYLRTKDDAEIDLIVERPGEKILFIEIKSKKNVVESDLSNLKHLSEDYGDCEAVCFSQNKFSEKFGNITVLPWQDGIKKFFIPIKNN